MAGYNPIIGNEQGRAAFKEKTNGMFEELYNTTATLGGQIENLDAEVDAHTMSIISKVSKSDLNNMKIKVFDLPANSNKIVTFSGQIGHFMVLARPALLAADVGVYFVHTYTFAADRWKVKALSTTANITITTGANTLNFAASAEAIDIYIVSYQGTEFV